MTPPIATNLEAANRIIAEAYGALTGHVETIATQAEMIAALQAERGEFNEIVIKLQSQVAWLTRRLFGPKSERFALDQHPLLPWQVPTDADAPAPGTPGTPGTPGAPGAPGTPEAPPTPAETQEVRYTRTKPGGRRSPIPADLPRIDRIVDLPEDQKAGMKLIGQEASEAMGMEPGRVYVIRTIRRKYARIDEVLDGSAPNIVVADMPVEGLPKCLAAPSLLAHLAVSKFGDHLPLYRLEGMLQRSGVDLNRSTMCRWMQDLGKLVMPLRVVMKTRVLRSAVIQTDETTVKQQDKGKGRTRTCYFTSHLGDGAHPYTLFAYHQGRHGECMDDWFTGKDGAALYHGLLQCDGYSGYNGLFDPAGAWKATHVGCWAHVRRKFFDVRTSFPGPAVHALGQIKLLYEVERKAREEGLEPPEVRALRQAESLPRVEAFFDWCEAQRAQALPKSGLGEALGYALNQKPSLQLYLEHGHLEIDNNACERSLRGIAIGRKNWLFTGSDAGGHAAAAMFSLIASAKRHDVEPLAYLTDVFTRLPATPVSQLEQFLPDRWQAPPRPAWLAQGLAKLERA